MNTVKRKRLSFDQSLDDPQSSPYRWVMLVILWGIYASFGIAQRSISPLITPILADLKMSYGQMGFVLGSWQLTYIATAIIAGFLIDRWGIRNSLFFGAIVIALSTCLRYFSIGFATFLPLVALIGVGGPMISIGSPKTIALWFRGKDRGTALGIYMTGPALGAALAFAATNRVIMPLTGNSWRLTFVFYGLLTLAAAFLWWFLSKEIETKSDSLGVGLKSVFIKLINVRNIQIILVSGLLSFAVIHGSMSWLPKIFENKGFFPAVAGYVSAIPPMACIPSYLILPRIIPPQKRIAALAVMALVTAASFWLLFNQNGVLMFAGLILFGFSSGVLSPLLILILMETPEVGARYLGFAGGLFFCISEVGGFTSPLVIGALVDWTGGFMAGGYFVIALSLGIFLLTFLMQNKRTNDHISRPQDTTDTESRKL